MKTPLCTYSIARCYISDSATVLGDDLTEYLLGKVRARDYQTLACIDSDLGEHSDNTDFVRAMRQIAAFFKKNSDFVDDDFCERAAISSFNRGERICRITNRRLDWYYLNPDRLDPDIKLYSARAEAWISHVLGPFDAFMDKIPSMLRVTSGATALASRTDSLPYLKLRKRVDCTPACAPYLRAAYSYFGYATPRIKSILWNRVALVPKSWKTHRTIACEPSGNVPFQLAFDDYAKSCLRRKTRIDLSTQERNQNHAYSGSVDGSLATIDLSMASDTVSLGAVGWLLPVRWYRYLSDTRSPFYCLEGGEMQKYAKFSSMGNGATFALETLIFASFLHAVGSKRGLAYGDDLTIETELVPDLLRLLKFFGFVPNVDKSFTSGPFRESCGADYHKGVNITPFYLRSTSKWDLPNTCHNVNGLARISPHGKLWEYLSTFIKSEKLPLTAVSYDTTSGVHLHPYFAYRRRLIRSGSRKSGDKWILHTSSLCRKTGSKTCYDSRTLFLWFLRKQATETTSDGRTRRFNHREPMTLLGSLSSDSRATRYTISSHKYARRWVNWTCPVMGLPEDLFSFSELVTRES